MATEISIALRNQILDGHLNAAAGIDFDSGVLELRSGAAPGADAAAAGTLIASITLPADSVDPAANGEAPKLGTWEDPSADATGTLAHWRLRQSGDAGGATGATDERYEGDITGTGGGGSLEVDNVSVSLGQQISITSWLFQMPAS